MPDGSDTVPSTIVTEAVDVASVSDIFQLPEPVKRNSSISEPSNATVKFASVPSSTNTVPLFTNDPPVASNAPVTVVVAVGNVTVPPEIMRFCVSSVSSEIVQLPEPVKARLWKVSSFISTVRPAPEVVNVVVENAASKLAPAPDTNEPPILCSSVPILVHFALS